MLATDKKIIGLESFAKEIVFMLKIYVPTVAQIDIGCHIKISRIQNDKITYND